MDSGVEQYRYGDLDIKLSLDLSDEERTLLNTLRHGRHPDFSDENIRFEEEIRASIASRIKLHASTTALKNACKIVLAEEFIFAFKLKSFYYCHFLLELLRLCGPNFLEPAFNNFMEDGEVAKELLEIEFNGEHVHLWDVLFNGFVKGLGNGEIIVPKSVRVSFLKTWMPVLAHLLTTPSVCENMTTEELEFRRYMLDCSYLSDVIKTVTHFDQKEIFQAWKNARVGDDAKHLLDWWHADIMFPILLQLETMNTSRNA